MIPVAANEYDTVAGLLGEGHRLIHSVMDAIARMLDDGESERAEEHARDLDGILRTHIRAEEEVLFPVFDARCGMVGPTAVMRVEHREIERLLEELVAALGGSQLASARGTLVGLGRLIGAHDLKEERVLYPRTDAVLSVAQRHALIVELKKALAR